jgi:hypothetical protein
MAAMAQQRCGNQNVLMMKHASFGRVLYEYFGLNEFLNGF